MKQTLRLISCHFVLLAGASLFADVVTLNDGRQVVGVLDSGSSYLIRMKVGASFEMIEVNKIKAIDFGSVQVPATQAVAAYVPPIAAATPASNGITLPAGTEIAVRTISSIDSKKAKKSEEFEVSLDDPIRVNGVELVPANSKAFLRVSESGRSSMSMSLVAISINGQRVDVNTDDVDSKRGVPAKRTAAGAVIGAGGGAIIGAAACGGACAAIGAGAGAAAGAATGWVTGKGVQIASETRFTYRLSQSSVINTSGGAR